VRLASHKALCAHGTCAVACKSIPHRSIAVGMLLQHDNVGGCSVLLVCRYNHFAGRLGLTMPETAMLLKRYPVEHHEFHWGQGTLTHADTAYQLWRGGLNISTLC
jgi:hypothetical protein